MAQLTIQQAFALAVQHHQAGRLREAEQLYRQVLAQQPEHGDALHYLGVTAAQVGRPDIAVDLIRRAIAAGASRAEVYSNLGNSLKDNGQLDEAIAAYRQALALNPNSAEAHRNLGNALQAKGLFDQAAAACRKAISLNPRYAQAHGSLGNALTGKEQFDEAIVAYRQAIALTPDNAEFQCNLANALTSKGEFDHAIAACRQAISRKPNDAQAHNNLGNALRGKGQLDEAIAAYRQAIALRPGDALAHSGLGDALQGKGQLDEAIAAYRQAIALKPNLPEVCNNLGIALQSQGKLDEAVAAYSQALALRSNYAESHNNLGHALQAKGQLDEALAAYRQALLLKPGYTDAHSNLVLALHYHGDYDARAIADEQRGWNRQHAAHLESSAPTHTNDRTPERPLRIGYVSPDFREHVVGRNILPLFRQHDRRQFEITCYAQVPRPDALTREFQQNADRWRSTAGLTDDRLAQQIHEDQIDILVDLALHTANNRLLVFARKPAPVQVTFAGYPASTGLSTIDYRLSDPYLDPFDVAQGGPPSMDESVYSERTIRLPHSFWCYDPLDCREIPVNPLPALETGVVTFGCLNYFCKVNDDVLTVWAEVLRQVANSRLLLLAPQGSHHQRTVDRLAQEGIDPTRVEFLPPQSRRTYLQIYHRIDLGLDSFPYNGHTTSLDSFWMGVPVVTLVGNRAVSRAGWCQLSNLGLSELAGETAGQFVRIAVELAKDLPRLQALRSTLRQRMERSPLMDAQGFARDVEAAYRQMWRAWCKTASARSCAS